MEAPWKTPEELRGYIDLLWDYAEAPDRTRVGSDDCEKLELLVPDCDDDYPFDSNLLGHASCAASAPTFLMDALLKGNDLARVSAIVATEDHLGRTRELHRNGGRNKREFDRARKRGNASRYRQTPSKSAKPARTRSDRKEEKSNRMDGIRAYRRRYSKVRARDENSIGLFGRNRVSRRRLPFPKQIRRLLKRRNMRLESNNERSETQIRCGVKTRDSNLDLASGISSKFRVVTRARQKTKKDSAEFLPNSALSFG